MKKMRTIGAIVCSMGLMLALTVLPTLAQERKPVIIGIMEPLTGPLATQGMYDMRGEEVAIEQINELGGVLGRPLKAVFEDTESRPKSAMDAVRKLVDINKVPIIIGPHLSSTTIPTAKYTGEKGIPQISVSATSPDVRHLGPHHFSIVGLDDLLGKYQARFAIQDSGDIKKWGIMTVNDPYGLGIGKVMRKEIERQGGEVVSFVAWESGKTDYRAELQRLFAGKPEGILSVSWGEMAKIQFKQAYEMGLMDQVKGNWYLPYPTNLHACDPETVEGIKGLDVFYGSPRTAQFVERFKKKYPEAEPNAYSARTYDAVWIAALAIDIAGSTESARILNVLPFVFGFYKGASSSDVSVDADGMQNTQIFAAWVVRDGKLERYTEELWGVTP
jgi:branched-chain amino acid transport system substrate-binding protein